MGSERVPETKTNWLHKINLNVSHSGESFTVDSGQYISNGASCLEQAEEMKPCDI
jgi:hypothetical protein